MPISEILSSRLKDPSIARASGYVAGKWVDASPSGKTFDGRKDASCGGLGGDRLAALRPGRGEGDPAVGRPRDLGTPPIGRKWCCFFVRRTVGSQPDTRWFKGGLSCDHYLNFPHC